MPLTVRIIHPDHEMFSGEVSHMLVPGTKGMLGLMPGHTPMFAEIHKGEIELQKVGSDTIEKLAVEGGILRIRDDVVTILASPEP